jgi:hypothetical protein
MYTFHRAPARSSTTRWVKPAVTAAPARTVELIRCSPSDDAAPLTTEEESDEGVPQGEPHVTEGEIAGALGARAAARVEEVRRGGSPLPEDARAFFEPRFGHDLGHVRIHADPAAADSARALGARAYTVGHDIAFGAGEYPLATDAGRRLLAHELTHVVQQAGQAALQIQQQSGGAKKPADPKPQAITVDPIQVLPDRTGNDVPAGKSAVTKLRLYDSILWRATGYADTDRIIKFTSAKVTPQIETVFRPDVNPDGPSGYGRGTLATDADKSLRFHESCHVADLKAYLGANPVPTGFTGRAGDTVATVKKAVADYQAQLTTHQTAALNSSKQSTDCVGTPAPDCAPAQPAPPAPAQPAPAQPAPAQPAPSPK